jgi:prephenate dehydratase
MRYNEKFEENGDLLNSELFYYPREKAIYMCIEGLIKSGEITDINSLADYAQRHELGYMLTKNDFLNMFQMVSTQTLTQDIRRLIDMSRRRTCWRLLQGASQNILDLTTDFEDEVNGILSSMGEIQTKTGDEEVADFHETLDEVKEIHSHPHALSQCSLFLRERSSVRVVPATNTAAAAAELASSGRRDVAVIAARECASLYGLEVIAENISDVSSNFTRFICISKKDEIYPDSNKFSVMMSLPHRSGALSDVLVKFSSGGVNLTKLESRPVPGSDFEFRFIFDFEATPHDPRVLRLLAGFASDPEIERFTFLGAYSEK